MKFKVPVLLMLALRVMVAVVYYVIVFYCGVRCMLFMVIIKILKRRSRPWELVHDGR